MIFIIWTLSMFYSKMHDRNIFRDAPPNFLELASEYAEFSPFLSKSASGKPYVNFKDPASLRALSSVLLKKYFDIQIEIPLDRLIPTIPLRLNYVHWIEDLVGHTSHENIIGIDIGCGASCVYALLLYKLHKWKMISTEIDDESIRYARDNVSKNNAENFITVLKSDIDGPILQKAVDTANRKQVDFTMCNPPFFEEVITENRTNHRPPPPGISTASNNESFTEGGEIQFIKKIINESKKLKDKVRWFTTMLGRKSSLKELNKYLQENDITTTATTEFRQGRTMRWGLAWSFTESCSNACVRVKRVKKAKPFLLALSESFFEEYGIPAISDDKKNICSTLQKIAEVLSEECLRLKISMEEIKAVTVMGRTAYEVSGRAFVNTWTHQRQKRRKEAHAAINSIRNHDNDLSGGPSVTRDREGGIKRTLSVDNCDLERKKVKLDEQLDEHKLFTFCCTIALSSQFGLADTNKASISFLCGDGDRDQFHQMFLYFKNFLKSEQINKK